MGGFADGIVFHQLLQTHSMLSARVSRTTVAGLETNMFWDGIFHAFTWLITALGIALLWRASRTADAILETKFLLGGVSLGWGMFNFVEGLISHHVLHLHHVVEGAGHLLFDLAFLMSGLMLLAGGALLIRSSPGTRPATPLHGTERER